MATPSIIDTEVLIVGAGPTGLVLALWLARRSVRVRIIEKTAEPGTTSRALAVQARTLEFYRQLGLSQKVVQDGRTVEAINLWVAGIHRAHVEFGAMGKGISPFPYALIYPQDEHEKMLIARLAEMGVRVERETELISFQETDGRISARLRLPGGAEESCSAKFIAGCDGAHSTVREQLEISFPGGTYEHQFYVADVEASGQTMNGELHAALDATDFLIVFPLKKDGHARLIGTIRDTPQNADAISWNDVGKRVMEWLRIDVKQVNWFSTYRVHHRVAESFHHGNAFLLGDAAHIHSPVGGQGMNTGIGDAVNLAWKLASVLRDGADASLLDTFEPERIAFAHKLVETTDRAFMGVTSSSAMARWFRLSLVPLVAPMLFRIPAVRRLMFQTVSQTSIEYRDSPLSEGRTGVVQAGDRLPWARLEDGSDNFVPLESLGWQLHVYGVMKPEVELLCRRQHMAPQMFPWRAEMDDAGLRRDALYLVRPDGYVAFATDGETGLARLKDYFREHRMHLPGGARVAAMA